MEVFRPLQLSFNHQVLEQGRRFYSTSSLTLGIDLQTGKALLDLDYFKDIFEGMGDDIQPDMGMPKPNGEFLVSGSFFSPDQQPVTGGEIQIKLGDNNKHLYIFGPRKWRAGLPSQPEQITSMPVNFSNAFGGEGFERNPDGIGFNDGLLPCIEHPRHLVASTGDTPDPACISPLNPILPQRMQYQGTYASDYKKKFFPGYPDDHDWKFFLCAPSDQWKKNGFYNGDEAFSIGNMHPEISSIEGRLPGLSARCFVNQQQESKEGTKEIFGELALNLDTIWFFPEKLIALLIFRGVLEVTDDEAKQITHVLCAFEDQSQPSRTLSYYKEAFQKRKTGKDALLKNLNTHDLIPENHKCAMELFMDMANTDGEKSPLSQNIEEKTKSIQQMADEKLEEAFQKAEQDMENIDIPDSARENMSEEAKKHMQGKDDKFDLKKMMQDASKSSADPDVEKLTSKMESIIPGITSNDAEKLDMKDFSFDKLDQLMDEMDTFSQKKVEMAKTHANKELKKAEKEIQNQIEAIDQQIADLKKTGGSENLKQIKSLEDSKKKMIKGMEKITGMNGKDGSAGKEPLPRIDTDKIKKQAATMDPMVLEAIQHLQSAKQMGVEDERTKNLDRQIKELMESTEKQLKDGLEKAEESFKEGYKESAHFMDDGLSPHKDSLVDVKNRFLDLVSKQEDVSGKDWACIDLSGENLDGINLSGAFLEQVDFTGASLKNANLSDAVLARATLDRADFSGADFSSANVGAVQAHGTNFHEANFNSAKLSKGIFKACDFAKANLEDIESLKMIFDHSKFHHTLMPKIQFLETRFIGVKCMGAQMSTSAFVKCDFKACDFLDCDMTKTAFIDTPLKQISFEKTDLSGACFVTVESNTRDMEDLNFNNSLLKQTNFQNMNLQRADLTYANMENAFFEGTDLTGADLSYSQAVNAQFRKATLIKATLDHINLQQGSLSKANLAGASFKNANLFSVDFLRSNISDTDFSNANLDTTLIEHWRPE